MTFPSVAYFVLANTYQEKGGNAACPTLSRTTSSVKLYQDYVENWLAYGK